MTEDSKNTIVTSLFNRNRSVDVMRYLHLANNNKLDASDKFVKVRPLLSMLNKNSLKNVIPKANKSIDESMAPYYGCKQYMQSKPVKFGYKL